MKKGLIFATTLALALGVGVAVGAHQKAAEVKAEGETTTVYCKMTYDWWKADSAAIAVHYWGGASAGTSWPGVRMTYVEGDTDVWKYSVPSDVTGLMFVRVNGSGTIADWGAKTGDLTLPADKNLYTITSSTAAWGDPGVTGVWSAYEEPVPVPAEYHLLGDFNTWKDPENEYVLTVDSEDSNHYTLSDVAMKKDEKLKVCDVPHNLWYGNQGADVVVGEDGIYDVDFYISADNDDHIVLTKHVVEPVYTVVNRGNEPVTFVLDEDEKPEGVKHQYSAEVQYAKRGGDLKFYADGVEITSNIGVDWDVEHDCPAPGNNVYGDATNGFYIAHTVNYSGLTKIYLKTYEDGGISLWANGYENNVFYSYIKDGQGGGQDVTLRLDESFVPDDTYIRQYKTSSAVAIKALAGTEWATSFGLDCSSLSEDVHPEADPTNNARQAFQNSAWKVHNDCNEVIYLKEKKADLSLWLYIGGYEEAVVVTIGDQEIALSKDGDQYVAHDVDLSAGDTVTAFTIEGEASEVASKKVANNNLTADKKVIADVEDADIYYNIADKNLWISGLPEGGQHLLVNGKTAIVMTHTDPYEGYDQYASGMLEFKANDTIKVLNTGVEDSYAVVWCPDIVATSEALKDKFVYDSEKDEMKCTADCSAAVYLKIKSGVDEVYFGDVPEYVEEAVEYVNGFKAAMATACSAEGKKAAVEAAWALQATAYAALSDQAKAEVYKGGYSLVDEIKEFGERYVYIYEHHAAEWELVDFLDWKLTPNSRYGADLANEANDSTMIIIITISATSALAFTTLLVFKKRKQK